MAALDLDAGAKLDNVRIGWHRGDDEISSFTEQLVRKTSYGKFGHAKGSASRRLAEKPQKVAFPDLEETTQGCHTRHKKIHLACSRKGVGA